MTTITETIEEVREYVRECHGQTVLNALDNEDLIVYALRFLKANINILIIEESIEDWEDIDNEN